MKSKRVGILMGGLSAERDVSIASGQAVERALRERGWATVPLYVDHDLDQLLRQEPIDVAFLALHGTWGEDGCVQGLLEVLGIPYTGSGVTASALAMDKLKAKELFRLYNVPTPPYYVVDASRLDDLEALHGSFGFPAFVKPRRQGSSIGAGRANDLTELRRRSAEAARYDRSILVERFVQGREIAIGVLDGEALGAVEIVPTNGFYDYRAKYQRGGATYHLPARLSPALYNGVLRIAERAVHSLGVEGGARVDVLVSPGENEYVLEVNTVPGMTETSLLPKIAQAAGYDFGALCEAILERACLRAMQVAATSDLDRTPDVDVHASTNLATAAS